MANKTIKPHGTTFSGSIAAGMSSVFNPGGRRYYILEHKVSSKYHKQGESQEIIVDTIELGRDSHCQVRFDESFSTVSRRHAAIIKDGDNWKLVQLSSTNPTLLNGKPIKTEWYLQNGDEIQLSSNGPKLGFIIPTGNKATVGSIGLTRRLSLFRQQAMRPYKTAITALCVLLLLSVGGLTTWNIIQKRDFDVQIASAGEKLNQLIMRNDTLQAILDSTTIAQAKQDSLLQLIEKRKGSGTIIYQRPITNLSKMEDDVFFISTTKVVVTDNQGTEFILKNKDGNSYGWIASGFLLDDGRFVTAKHCIEGWKFYSNFEQLLGVVPTDTTSRDYFFYALSDPSWKIVSHLRAQSKTKTLYFKSTDFVTNNSTETNLDLGYGIKIPHSPLSDGTDWAYAHCSQKGSIHADAGLSSSLNGGEELDVLGYPHGKGALDAANFGPLYGSCKAARKGLNNNVIEITAKNYESGNSGGPVFVSRGGKNVVVGIVSYSSYSTMGGLTPIANLNLR